MAAGSPDRDQGGRLGRGSRALRALVASAVILAASVALATGLWGEGTLAPFYLGIGFSFLTAFMAAATAPVAVQKEQRARTRTPDPVAVLIVSNGHGEDAVGMALADELQPRARITAFPLVGTGGAYHGVPVLEPRRPMPSGGFALRGSWRRLWADLRAGTVAHWLAQRATLRAQRGRHDLVVAIGDVYCLQMAALVRAPIVFIATAKSEYNEPHRWLERLLIRRHATLVFTRDLVTADVLRRAGLPAEYVGNPLMDTIGITGSGPAPGGTRTTVTILPGSRTDAYENLRPLLHLCEEVASRVGAAFVCALAPGLDVTRVRAAANALGWQTTDDELRHDGVTVHLTRAFAEAVQAADIVVGLAGTANEQAAGLGKPVVTFIGPGSQVTRPFVALQKRLLGDALVAAQDWREAAGAVVRLLQDSSERARRGTAGRERMGQPGAVRRIAQTILQWLRRPNPQDQHSV